MSDYSTHERLLRTKSGTGDDTAYAAGATTPTVLPAADAQAASFSAIAPNNKGANTHLELSVVAVDASGVVQARGTCAFTLRLTKVVDRGSAGDGTQAAVAVEATALASQSLQTLIRIPINGGDYFVGLESIANAPGGATDFQIWGKTVSG